MRIIQTAMCLPSSPASRAPRCAGGTPELPQARSSGRIRVRTKSVEVPALNAEEGAACDAAMKENALLKAVLDDLKGESSTPATTSRRRCVELGERLRAETGLSLTAFRQVALSNR